MQFEHLRQTVEVVGQLEGSLNTLGGDTGDAGELLGADIGGQLFVVTRAARTAMPKDRFSRCICSTTSSAMRTSAECENAPPKSTSDTSGPE